MAIVHGFQHGISGDVPRAGRCCIGVAFVDVANVVIELLFLLIEYIKKHEVTVKNGVGAFELVLQVLFFGRIADQLDAKTVHFL
ncbi:hypothetical protein D3C87_1673630 [compost metagenome]